MLTRRQREIAAHVSQGKSYKAIARETGLSARTVVNHMQDAASRLPGDGRPRDKIMIWFLSLDDAGIES